ncbi:Hypothetical predicted protein [Cloeon dipterum]|uniref:Peptidase S1 domain-containing protein n=1 Tax=Cloeon dipterum TaxID=197152 RepID=A0A8S1CLM5_9INSE|nr:Hypothetical predicted protein [Cloeon dipterum]
MMRAWKAVQLNHSNAIMKTILALTLVLVVAAQSADWHKIQSFRNAIGASHANSVNIVGGRVAPPGLLPFQVLIWYQRNGRSKICGGSLIKEDQVLTAAHCCYEASFFVVFHATINYEMEEPNRKNGMATRYTMHESYNNVTDAHDVCIIHLDEEVRGEGIATIRLPSRSQAKWTLTGKIATISGYGRTKNSNTRNTVLRYTDVIIMNSTICSRYYPSFNATILICAKNVANASGTCKGDSGGPLTITESDGVKTQVGISSYGPLPRDGGCESLRPDGYVRITYYLDWIKRVAGL